jgi:NAD(P)-dependent dehydrogenase (short-subunit alcohol dehydrogenase family)
MAGRIVLIAGASRGLGYCLAERHLALGDEVHMIVRKRTDAVERLLENPLAHAHIGDVSGEKLLLPAVESFHAAAKRLDILYNVAAVLPEKDLVGLPELETDIIAEVVNVNAAGPLRVLKLLSDRIGPDTRIINVSSESGSIENNEETCKYAYNMSKAALNLATKSYYNATHAKIICVCPGWMRTDMGGQSAWLDPQFSAEKISELADRMDELEPGYLFYKYDGRKLPW